MVSCCCGRQRFGERQRGTTCTVWMKLLDWFSQVMCMRGQWQACHWSRLHTTFRNQSNNFIHTVYVVPRCRSPNLCLPQQQDIICCKISVLRSWWWAKIARNMLSWSWRSINYFSSIWFFYITLPHCCLRPLLSPIKLLCFYAIAIRRKSWEDWKPPNISILFLPTPQ